MISLFLTALAISPLLTPTVALPIPCHQEPFSAPRAILTNPHGRERLDEGLFYKRTEVDVEPTDARVFEYTGTKPGKPIKSGAKLRILGVGDSITVGFGSGKNGGDGNGYRKKLMSDLSHNEVEFVGSETRDGTMDANNRFGAWSGKTIKFITDHIDRSLKQKPNIVLVHAGTNDMNSNPETSVQGNDPAGAAVRLGKLIDKIVKEVPDAVVLVAQIINTCAKDHGPRTKVYQSLIPGVVKARRNQGHHVMTVDFTTYGLDNLSDCVHPSNAGYRLLGDYWYDFITQIPPVWIQQLKASDSEEGPGSAYWLQWWSRTILAGA